jgi:hypothetical protein
MERLVLLNRDIFEFGEFDSKNEHKKKQESPRGAQPPQHIAIGPQHISIGPSTSPSGSSTSVDELTTMLDGFTPHLMRECACMAYQFTYRIRQRSSQTKMPWVLPG